MKWFHTIIAAALMTTFAGSAMADDPAIEALRQDVARMRQDYEARIRALEKRLAQAETSSNRAVATAAEAKRAAVALPPAPSAPAEQPPASQTNTKPQGSASAFNPAIGVTLNGTAAAARRDPDAYRIPGLPLGADSRPTARGLAVGESEINLSANIDQALYGSLTVSYARDNTFSVEEAFIQSVGLPGGFTVKAGRFRSGIGTLNDQHAHTWDFVDAPLPYLVMLNGQYGDDGVQARWLAPTAMFVELGAEAFRGTSFPANGAGNKGFGTLSAFAHAGDDIGEGGTGGSWRMGLSGLVTRASGLSLGADTFSGNDRIGIVDAVYKWAPDGNFADRYVKLQGEYFYRASSGQFDGVSGTTQQQGFYLQAVWQFMPRWRAGARYDQVWGNAPSRSLALSPWDPRGHVGSRESIMIDYSTSEFGRFRLQANLDHSTGKDDRQLILQYTVSLGAHGAHTY